MGGITTLDVGRLEWIRLQCKPGSKIIDIGCNTGHTFAGWDRTNITSVDIDRYEIENFVQSDAKDMPFKDKEFEVGVLAEIVEHTPDPIEVIREAWRVCDKLIVSVPYEHLWDERLHPFTPPEESLKIYGHKDFKDMAKSGNPSCKEFYTEDNYAHLHHHRFYTPEALMEDINKAIGDDCETTICIVKNRGMYCICVVIYE